MTIINCKVSECKHNKNGTCSSESIIINLSTFYLRDGFKPTRAVCDTEDGMLHERNP